MTVKAERLTATCNISKVVKGEALTLVVEVFDEVSGQAFDLADLDDATATFLGLVAADGTSTPVEVNATANGDPGRVDIELTADDTNAMRVAEGQSWQLSIVLGDGTHRIVQLVEQLDVVASLF